jgi:hypothetical protein
MNIALNMNQFDINNIYFCDPIKNTSLGSFVEHNPPKISNETLDELRRIWLTLSSKICPKPVNQKL